MTAFLFTIWRLAFARDRYDAIGGWRRLFWRVWWRLPAEPVPPPLLQIVRAEVPKSAAVLHWSPDERALPLCGEREGVPWTREFEFVTCETCRAQGWTLLVQYLSNTR